MRSISKPVSRSDIESLYAGADAAQIELTTELVEYHMQRGRFMRAQVASEILRSAGRGLKRLFGGAGRRDHPHGNLKPSNV